jgi:hypothetical protein
MEDAQRQGFTFSEYFARGTIPLPQVGLFERAWNLLLQVHTDRADREGHPMDVDPETGEVIETPTESHEAPTWCGATRSEWQDLYESASNDSEWVELDPEEELPF